MPNVGHGRMLAVERRQRILDMLGNRSSVLIADICRECGVSAVTARADLDYLEGEGRLKRTHGGAVPVSEYVIPRVSERVRKNARAKQAIARRAAERVSDGEMILVGSGSTTLEFVKALHGKRDVTVVTNSCHIIEYAEQHLPDMTIMSTGGVLARKYRHYYGPLVAASLTDVYLDQVFLGADGFEPSFGFLAEYEQTAYAKVEFLRHARTKVVLMDSSKVGAGRSFLRFAKPEDVDVVIMERDPDGMVVAACNRGEREVEVVQALDGDA
ncbi:DeoR/GlpR transcriptional regulator [Olsenella uli]|uniref:DeoR/GlpR family DNA-binding transcription regulator n=1 Tax=Olsenella uli TaxID=133926 RepID=UPI001958C126|nr:DeoR/GlpR family DNA-binding transcription regulator [Olsenella uli]MBM6676431.1 DeoR/GlpR transcriptional regulator [Olsenella uli]